MKALLALALALPLYANADDLWVSTGLWSRHPNEDHYKYNQHNVGIGLSYEKNNYAFVLGEYDNSLRKHSDYIGVINYPYNLGPVRFGYLAGFVSGYTERPQFMPAVAPVVSYEYRSIGVNFVIIPSVVTAVQLKFKLW